MIIDESFMNKTDLSELVEEVNKSDISPIKQVIIHYQQN